MALWNTKSKSKKDTSTLLRGIKSILLSSQGFPIFLSITGLAIMLIMYRMKAVEQDYAIINTNQEINRLSQENKELKAHKARLLSINSIKEFARLHNLHQPEQTQIIVIP